MEGFRRETLIGSEYVRVTIWPLVFGFLASLLLITTGQSQELQAHFVGSESCRKCHAGYTTAGSRLAWQTSCVIRNSIPMRFSETSHIPIRFARSVWIRWRSYMAAAGSNGTLPNAVTDYFPLSAQWDVKKGKWLPYHVEAGTDWWVPFYGPSNFDRPTGPTCDGCHSVNYDIQTRQVTEWNVGCEKCHGPGSLHVQHPTKSNIVNPANLDYVRGNDVCIQCHSQGQPLKNPIEGKYYDWPVGFLPGSRLADYWNLEELKPGTTNFYQYAELTAHKNRMQGNDFVQSTMYHRQIRCFDCHQVHSNQNTANLVAVGNAVCLFCHTKDNPAGLKGTVSEHTHHAEGSSGSQCVTCHMPKIEQTIKDNFVHAHTFRFITPAETDQSGIPNPCTSCHTDKSTSWATNQLRSWSTTSPWRVTQ